MPKSATNWGSSTKETTNFQANSVLTNAVKLNDMTVKLNSLVVTITGYAIGAHFSDNKSNTPFSKITKNNTGFSTPSKETTAFGKISKNNTAWSTP